MTSDELRQLINEVINEENEQYPPESETEKYRMLPAGEVEARKNKNGDIVYVRLYQSGDSINAEGGYFLVDPKNLTPQEKKAADDAYSAKNKQIAAGGSIAKWLSDNDKANTKKLINIWEKSGQDDPESNSDEQRLVGKLKSSLEGKKYQQEELDRLFVDPKYKKALANIIKLKDASLSQKFLSMFGAQKSFKQLKENNTITKSELKALIRETIEEVMGQQATKTFVVDGDKIYKAVDMQSIQIDGASAGDYADAHISLAKYMDGTELNDKELDQLNSMAKDWIAQKAIKGDV